MGELHRAPHLRPGQVGGDAHPALPAQLEERVEQVVVARIEQKVGVGEDPPGLVEVGGRLLHGDDVADPGQLREQVRLEVQHDPLGDVVDDDRPAVGRLRDRGEMGDDAGARRLVVVGRDGQERVGARLDRGTRERDRVVGVVGAGVRHDAGAPAHLLDEGVEQVDLLPVAHGGALAGRPAHDDAVRARLDQMAGQPAGRGEVD